MSTEAGGVVTRAVAVGRVGGAATGCVGNLMWAVSYSGGGSGLRQNCRLRLLLLLLLTDCCCRCGGSSSRGPQDLILTGLCLDQQVTWVASGNALA